MAIKLIALDLDGTLLTDAKTIDEYTRKQLLRAQRLGIVIVIATGRDKGGISFVYEALQLESIGNNYIAGVNGQIIYSFKAKEYQMDNVLSGLDANKIMRLAKKMHFECIACCGYDHYDYITTRLKAWKRLRSFFKGKPMDYGFAQGLRRFITIRDEEFLIRQDVNKFVLIQSATFFKKHLPTIRASLCDYDVLEVGPSWIEVMPKGVHKASALLKIGAIENISPQEMMAFGDAENDREMLATVKYGIAMKNAMASLKQIAYDVCDDNNHQGIAKTLQTYIFDGQKDV